MKPFYLTYVEHEEHNIISWIIALFTLSPVYIMVMYATLIGFNRDIQSVVTCIGQLTCVCLNILISLFVNQPRPESSYTPGNGFPSDHSQFMAFFACYNGLLFLNKFKFDYYISNLFCVAILLVWSFIVAFSRYYLGQHTVFQIACGYVFGFIYGLIWYYLTFHYFMYYYDAIVNKWPFNWLYFKNYNHILNRLKFEYDNANKCKRENNKIYDIQESPEDYIEGYDDGDVRHLNETSHTLSENDLSILPTLNIIARHKAISPISMRVNEDYKEYNIKVRVYNSNNLLEYSNSEPELPITTTVVKKKKKVNPMSQRPTLIELQTTKFQKYRQKSVEELREKLEEKIIEQRENPTPQKYKSPQDRVIRNIMLTPLFCELLQQQREKNKKLTAERIKLAQEKKKKAEEDRRKYILSSTTESRVVFRRQKIVNKFQVRRRASLWFTLIALTSRSVYMKNEFELYKPMLSVYWHYLYPCLRILIYYRMFRKRRAYRVIRKFVMNKIFRVRLMAQIRAANTINTFLSSLFSIIDLRSVVKRYLIRVHRLQHFIKNLYVMRKVQNDYIYTLFNQIELNYYLDDLREKAKHNIILQNKLKYSQRQLLDPTQKKPKRITIIPRDVVEKELADLFLLRLKDYRKQLKSFKSDRNKWKMNVKFDKNLKKPLRPFYHFAPTRDELSDLFDRLLPIYKKRESVVKPQTAPSPTHEEKEEFEQLKRESLLPPSFMGKDPKLRVSTTPGGKSRTSILPTPSSVKGTSRISKLPPLSTK